MGLAEFLASMEPEDREDKSEGLPEAQIERLREVSARIAAGNPFKPGDLVTVRKDAPVKGAGKPHLVIEIDHEAKLCQGEVGNWTGATRHDVIVLSVTGGDIAPHTVPHWMLERYTGPQS